jgi:hypothetical protein
VGEEAVVGPPRRHILETEVDGDVTLYDPESERVTVLNGSASDVWRLADGGHTLAEVIELLAKAYQTEANSISDEVEQTVRRFADAGLIEDR